jgi:shikimate kinase
MKQTNLRSLKKNGWVVWLKAEVEEIRERMDRAGRSGDSRPSLTGIDPLEEIHPVFEKRTRLYARACDHTVNTRIGFPPEVADAIIGALPAGIQP